MDTLREQIAKRMEKLKGTLSPKEIHMQEEALVKIIEEGQPIYQALGVSEEALEFMYSYAYNLYNGGKYKEARQTFFMLDFLNPTDVKYSYSIAACCHMNKEYYEAIGMYMKCSLADPNNPVYFWHIADCYKRLNKKVFALLNLRLCIRYCKLNPAFGRLELRAENEFLYIEKEVEEEIKNSQTPVPNSKS